MGRYMGLLDVECFEFRPRPRDQGFETQVAAKELQKSVVLGQELVVGKSPRDGMFQHEERLVDLANAK